MIPELAMKFARKFSMAQLGSLKFQIFRSEVTDLSLKIAFSKVREPSDLLEFLVAAFSNYQYPLDISVQQSAFSKVISDLLEHSIALI